MSDPKDLDGVLVQWGDRLFYPGNRLVRPPAQARLRGLGTRECAAAVRRAPHVMVQVTGGGRSMPAIVAHLRYISKNGRLEMEDELGQVERGRPGLHAIAEDWRLGGSRIPASRASAAGARPSTSSSACRAAPIR